MRKDYSTSRALGIVGLGIMGGAMAQAFLAAGYTVYGYDPVTAHDHNMEGLRKWTRQEIS